VASSLQCPGTAALAAATNLWPAATTVLLSATGNAAIKVFISLILIHEVALLEPPRMLLIST
jgi:hypothetical protein